MTTGEGDTSDKLKALGVSVIEGLEAIIPAVVAKIVVEDTLKLGFPLGLIAGGGASAVLYAALEFAKGKLQGAEQGGLITKNYTGKVGKTDDRIMAVGTGEFIVNRNAVQKGNNLQILKALNNGEDFNNLAKNTLSDIVYNGNSSSTIINDYKSLEHAINAVGEKISNTRVEVYDKGKIEINDNRKIEYKKNNSYRG